MSVLSGTDIIAKNQIGNGLDAFRRLSRAKHQDLGISEVRQLMETSGTGKLKQPLVNSKLSSQAYFSTAIHRVLLSRKLSVAELSQDIFLIRCLKIDSGEFDVRLIASLPGKRQDPFMKPQTID
jgi:hypothetical protein